MNSQMLLNRNAVIYEGGSLGRTIARAVAKEGAYVFLAGRRLPSLKEPLHTFLGQRQRFL
jgi:NADP-dependent 3-hydroxy acid dehydrogenase YdfG